MRKSKKGIADDHAKICDGNSWYREFSLLIDDAFLDELRAVRSQMGQLEERVIGLHKKMKPQTRVVPSSEPDAPSGAMKTIHLDFEHWSRVAQFTDSEVERRAAEKKLIEFQRDRRELANLQSDIDALREIERQLEAAEPDARWFRV